MSESHPLSRLTPRAELVWEALLRKHHQLIDRNQDALLSPLCAQRPPKEDTMYYDNISTQHATYNTTSSQGSRHYPDTASGEDSQQTTTSLHHNSPPPLETLHLGQGKASGQGHRGPTSHQPPVTNCFHIPKNVVSHGWSPESLPSLLSIGRSDDELFDSESAYYNGAISEQSHINPRGVITSIVPHGSHKTAAKGVVSLWSKMLESPASAGDGAFLVQLPDSQTNQEAALPVIANTRCGTGRGQPTSSDSALSLTRPSMFTNRAGGHKNDDNSDQNHVISSARPLESKTSSHPRKHELTACTALSKLPAEDLLFIRYSDSQTNEKGAFPVIANTRSGTGTDQSGSSDSALSLSNPAIFTHRADTNNNEDNPNHHDTITHAQPLESMISSNLRKMTVAASALYADLIPAEEEAFLTRHSDSRTDQEATLPMTANTRCGTRMGQSASSDSALSLTHPSTFTNRADSHKNDDNADQVHAISSAQQLESKTSCHPRKQEVAACTPVSALPVEGLNWLKRLQKKKITGAKRQGGVFQIPLAVSEKKRRRTVHIEESAADKALSDLEEIMDSKHRPKRKFTVPSKEAQKNSLTQDKQQDYIRVPDLSECELQRVSTQLSNAPEVALTLTYTDGASLLTPTPGQAKTKRSSLPQSLDSLVLACPLVAEERSSLAFIAFPFTHIKDAWSRKTISDLMNGKARKICYRADELIIVLQKHVGLQKDGVAQWTVLDPGVAHWLLHSDHPSRNFGEVLEALPDVKPKAAQCEPTTVSSRLRLVGPAMAVLYRKLREAHLWDIFLNMETPLTPILAAMHLRGIKVHPNELVKTAGILERKLSELEEAAHMAAGRKFCLNSHAQLRQILFEDLHLDKKLEEGSKVARTLVEGQKSTSQSVLHLLRNTHQLPAIVLEHRQLQKLKSTYVDGILSCVRHSESVHTRWTQVSASTGRLAATQPNLQAVPKVPVLLTVTRRALIGQPPEEFSICARDPFYSRPGYTLLSADFQQIEFRLLAHLSSDETLLKVFNGSPDSDIFIELTAQWLNKDPSDVTPADREQTKRVVYSVMYGAGKDRLSDYLKIDTSCANDIILSFLVAYPGVNAFTKKCICEAQKKGYQTTLFGRRRQLPHIRHPAFNVRAQAERQAVNFCVQGSAADLCKAAMILIERQLVSHSHLEARLLLQIHDELLFEVNNDHFQEVADIIKTTMEDRDALCGSSVRLQVPLAVSLAHGQVWGHMTPYVRSSTCT